MLFLKPLYLKFLDGEISAEEYKQQIKPTRLMQAFLLHSFNMVALYVPFSYFPSYEDPNNSVLKPDMLEHILLLYGPYFIGALIYEIIMYRQQKKEAIFLINQKRQYGMEVKNTNFSSEDIKIIIPIKAQKLYTSGKISRIKYVKTVFAFVPFATKTFFTVFFIPLLFFFPFGTWDPVVRFFTSYIIVFFLTFFVLIHLAAAKSILYRMLAEKNDFSAIFEKAHKG